MTTDPTERLKKLQQLFENGLLEQAEYELLRANLEKPADYQAETQSGAIAQGVGATAVAAGAVNIAGSVAGNIYIGEPTDDPVSALRIYRRVLVATSGQLPLRGVDVGASDPTKARRQLGLSNVYVDLDTTTQVRTGSQSRREDKMQDAARDAQEARPLPALEATINNRWLIITGDPGSGKSTFVNHLAHCLAAHALQPGQNWLAHLNGWPTTQSDLLPIIVVLRDFARNLTAKATPHALLDFIKSRLKDQNLEFVVKPLTKALENGRCLLLLDGLDELPTQEQRLFIRDVVAAFAKRYPGNRYLLTCRILSYQQPASAADPDLRLNIADFPVFELAPFDVDKINRFVDAWYVELARLGTVRSQDVDGLVQRLKTAVRRPDLWRLAPNPLLLTVMALVHTHQGRLPDSRALLYEQTVDMLLWRWEAIKAGGDEEAPPLRQLLLDAERSDMDLKRLLWRLAFEAHSQTRTNADEDALADISESKLTRALEALNRGDWNWAHQMVETMKLRAGLLLERAPGVFTFPHRTFQEYLAGAYLSTQGNFSTQALNLAAQGPQWREVVLLAVGRLMHLSGDTDKPYALINRLCPINQPDNDVAWQLVWKAGLALQEIGLQRVRDDEWGEELLQRVCWHMAALLSAGHLTPRERMDAGDTLAQLGDPRPGVCTLEPDLVSVPAGEFLMGDNKVPIMIKQPFAIGRYPVTNSQYRQFVADGGYTELWRHCWTDDGWQERELGRWIEPRYWESAEYGQANQPVVRVSWYEAVAYANWLAAKTNKPYRLPTEAEWERAARHTDGRIYPWGDSWEDGYANTKELGLDRPTAVGLFPADKAVCGVQDMAGNVIEWCQTRWHDEQRKEYSLPYQDNDEREDISGNWQAYRVIRGGHWLGGHENRPRCTFRGRYHPGSRHYYFVGFRVVIPPLSLDAAASDL